MKKRVRTASWNGVPVATNAGSVVGRTRSPSGSQPSAAGSGRTSHRANGTMPTTHTTPRIGVAVARPRSSISHLANGVSRMPPADSPVDATDRATDRRTWYQRVTTVVTGTSPAPAKPRANTAYTSVQLPVLLDLAEHSERQRRRGRRRRRSGCGRRGGR